MNAAAIAWTLLAGYAGFRTIVRPYRAVVVDGMVSSCSGSPGCNPAMELSTSGDSRVLAPVGGRVLQTSGGVLVAAEHEPVVLSYAGLSQAAVALGQRVRPGQTIGTSSGKVRFAVSRIERGADGKISLQPLVPSAWLAARGARLSGHAHPSGLWCGQGRRLSVPQAAGRCNLRLPDPARFAILPVSVSMQ